MQIDLSELSPNKIYHALIQSILPRPIAWVLSDNGDDSFNLAPFSFFNGVSSDPPLVSLSLGKKPDGSQKDTCVNIAERKDFIIHIPHRELAQQVTASSASLPHGESELTKLALETVPLENSRLPRVVGPRIAFVCEKFKILEIGNTPQALILGRVRSIFYDDSVAEFEGERLKVDAKKVDPLARLGGNDYGLFGELLTVLRPK